MWKLSQPWRLFCSEKPKLKPYSAVWVAYQDINSATHSIINVVVSQNDGSVVQQSLHEFGNQANKPDAILFLLWRKWVEQFGHAEVEKKWLINCLVNAWNNLKRALEKSKRFSVANTYTNNRGTKLDHNIFYNVYFHVSKSKELLNSGLELRQRK